MEFLLSTQEERCRMEIYSEYLKKIPDLLKQLETVEKMYQKALLEESLFEDNKEENYSVQQYSIRLENTKRQCEERHADILQQLHLIYELKRQIEQESSVLQFFETLDKEE